jgi:predicted NBD/HSP70 family sugar kinase
MVQHQQRQVLAQIPHIAGIEDLDVLGYLRSRFGPAVDIENDVNLAMLGEHAFGRARGCRNAAFLALGTGTGLGLLIDNKLFRGASGAAGEIADLPVLHETESNTPSAIRTFELEAGSLAIVERYRRQGGTAGVTVRDIFALLETGDALASSILDATARCVALAVVTLQSLLDLELIVFGGSIGLRSELHDRIRRILPGLFPRPINIAPSELGDRAGIVGAAWAAGRTLRQDSKAAS